MTESTDSEQDLRDADFSQLENPGNSEEPQDLEACATNAKIRQLEQELAEHKDRQLRTLADLENLRKRTIKERSELLKYQGERVLADMLEVLDNLERALEYSSAAAGQQSETGSVVDSSKLREGVELIHKQFLDVLSKWEVRAESGVGKEFDPTRYQAIGQVQMDDQPAGKIVGEMKKAYFYKDRLLRVGEVIVSAGSAEKSESEIE